VADRPSPERLREDLGLGGKFAERSRARLLNRDGTFNVRRNTLSPLHPYNAYHTLLLLPVSRLLALVAACYGVANLAFASVYWLAGPEALSGAAVRAAQRPAVRAVHPPHGPDGLQPQRPRGAVRGRLGADVPARQPP
jgi:hypothetical protein